MSFQLDATSEFFDPPQPETGQGVAPPVDVVPLRDAMPGMAEPGGGAGRSPYEIMQDALGGPQVPTDGSGSPYDILARALNDNPGPAQHPLSAEQRFFQDQNPNGGGFIHRGGGNMPVEQQAFQDAFPGGGRFTPSGKPQGGPPALPGMGEPPVPGTGGPPAPGTGGQGFNGPLLGDHSPAKASGDPYFAHPGQPFGNPTTDQYARVDPSNRIVVENGRIVRIADQDGRLYNTAWDGYDNIVNNAQHGDPIALEKVQLAARAGDARAQTVLGGLPQDFLKTESAAQFAQSHNAEQAKTKMGEQWQVNPNPLPDNQVFGDLLNGVAHLPGDDVAKLTQALDMTGRKVIGVRGGDVYFQGLGGPGDIRRVPAWEVRSALLEILADEAKKQDAVAQPGGYPPRGGSPRGPSGPPPRQPVEPPAALPSQPGPVYGSVNGYPEIASGTPFNNAGKQQYPLYADARSIGGRPY